MRDARRFGLPQDQIDALARSLAAGAEDDCAVWPENAEAVRAFLAVDSQWRVTAVGGGLAPARPYFVGLDYAAARAGIAAAGIAITPELWAGLRVMEGEALKALNGTDG
ncbi:MAG: DUF1799 domain-containing protein [Xanthobacteraceae bacterium]